MDINSTRLFKVKITLGILFLVIGFVLFYLSSMMIFFLIFLFPALFMALSFFEEPTPLLNSKIIIDEKNNIIHLINYPVNVPDGGKKCIINTNIDIYFNEIDKFEKIKTGILNTILVKCKNTLEFRMYLNRNELDYIDKLLYIFAKNCMLNISNKRVKITDADGDNAWSIDGIITDVKFDYQRQGIIVKSENDVTIEKWTSSTFLLLNRYEGENLLFNDRTVNVLFLHKNCDLSSTIKDLTKNSDFVFIGNLHYVD